MSKQRSRQEILVLEPCIVNLDELPEPICRWMAAERVDVIQPTQPGMSGARVFRCQSRSGQTFALKRWPHATQRSRIQEIHHVLTAARRNQCDLVPQIRSIDTDVTFVLHDGAFWELADWMSGSPLPPTATLSKISSGAAAIAKFHQAVALTRQMAVAPAVTRRLQRCQELHTLLPQAIQTETSTTYSVPLRESIAEISSLLLGTWSIIHDRIIRRLSRWSQQTFPLQYVLRDVHREHILFHDGTVSGLIDFDAVRIDTPLTDLARWGGSFTAQHGEPDEVWQAVMAGYAENSPFQIGGDGDIGEAITLLRDLHLSSTWISLANWAVWIRLESRRFPAGDAAVQGRINGLCRSARQLM